MVANCSRVMPEFMSVPSLTPQERAQRRASSAQEAPVTLSPSARASMAQTMALVRVALGSKVSAEVPSMRPRPQT